MTRPVVLLAFLAALLTAGLPAHAQDTAKAKADKPVAQPVKQDDIIKPLPGPSMEKSFEQAVNKTEDRSFFTLNIENDMFAWRGEDENYTNGIRLTYHKVGAPLPHFARTLDHLVPMFRTNKATNIYYSIGHNMYTPKNIQDPNPQPNDRPWAAYLYGSAGLTTITNNRIDEIEGSLGVIGPAALGEPIQKNYHKLIDSPEPRGWSHQLKNEPALMLSWNRRFPERYSIDMPEMFDNVMTLTAEPNIGVTAGNVYTFGSAGMSFRLTPFAGSFQDAPIKVRPSMPGTGAFIIPDGLFAWSIFGGVEGRAVARNIFLDGNTFTDSYSVDKKPFVYDATLGVSTAYGKSRISYALVYRSKEFDTQEDPSIFGTISLGYRF